MQFSGILLFVLKIKTQIIKGSNGFLIIFAHTKIDKPIMKKIALLFFGFVFVFTSCTSSKKNLQKGNYDAIITHSIKKLIKNPDANKQAVLLDKAFLLANERDLEAINYLKLEGQAGSWEKIFQHYDRLKQRQNQLKRFCRSN